jgi:hypothetical protein
MNVSLDNDEWQRVLAILAQAPWATANPLIMKIGEQLRVRMAESASAASRRGNGVEAEVSPHS